MNSRAVLINMLTIFAFLFFCATGLVSPLQDEDTAAIDAFIARQARRERGEEYRDARKVVAGDLTHDSSLETVVLYTIESQGGSNLYIQYLAVFVRRNGKLSPLTHVEVGGKSVRSVELRSVEGNSILLDTMSYGPKDAQCCPSVKGATRYVLSGRTLREQKHGSRKSAYQIEKSADTIRVEPYRRNQTASVKNSDAGIRLWQFSSPSHDWIRLGFQPSLRDAGYLVDSSRP